MTGTLGNPAESLMGVTLATGWEITEIIKRKPEDTGGHFSVCYIAEKDGKKGFLKALDLSFALESEDFLKMINDLTTAFLFERDLIYKCRESHLSKIVTPLEYGEYSTPGQPKFLTVYYIIFEVADSNLRSQISMMDTLDVAWILRSLHHTAVGLNQLHKNGIAHQDLKPSNVLVFEDESKLSDLGRSSDVNLPSRNDKLIVPGDKTYAPFELFYGIGSSGEFKFRYSSDLFHLGSLIFFYFLRMNLQQIVHYYLKKNDYLKNLSDNFDADLPYFQLGFNYALELLKTEIDKMSETMSNDLLPLVKMLCNPDYRKRGYIKNVEQNLNQYSLERFISRFDHIAKKAEFKIR